MESILGIAEKNVKWLNNAWNTWEGMRNDPAGGLKFLGINFRGRAMACKSSKDAWKTFKGNRNARLRSLKWLEIKFTGAEWKGKCAH